MPDDARKALDLLRGFGGDALVRQLLATFLSYGRSQVTLAEAAVIAGDLPQIARVGHSLKSSSRQVGANALADACDEVERRALAADPAAGEAVAEMARAFDAARAWMEPAAAGR